MRWLAGTSGYSYKEWKGSFYPDDTAANAMLGYYASRLPAVEINNTFYRMPRSSVLATWRDAVPEDFRFAIKASRQITHRSRLADCEDSVAYLATRLEALGDKLGCVLFQLPPYLRKDIERLDAFLALWPDDYPAAVEFRHASWFDDETAETLASHGAALCVSEDGKLALPDRLATTEWLYCGCASRATKTPPCSAGSTGRRPPAPDAGSPSSSTRTTAPVRPWPDASWISPATATFRRPEAP